MSVGNHASGGIRENFTNKLIGLCVWVCVLVLFPMDASAQGMSWGEEFSRRINSLHQIQPLGDDTFGDEISLYDGSTTLNVTDITIAGNSDIPVALSRTWNPQNHGLSQQVVADWVIDVPNLNGMFIPSRGWPEQRCTQAAPPPGVTSSSPPNYLVLPSWQFWTGNQLNLSGSGNDMMLSMTSDPKLKKPLQSLGASSPWTTKSGWYFGCLASLQRGAGEGFVGYAPDGKRYTFDWMVQDSQRAMAKRGRQQDFFFIVPRALIRIYATKVEDRFGNWVRYEWSGDRLQRIYSNDGREIVLNYDADHRLSAATANERTWNYEYEAYAIPQQDARYLSKVILPDASQWRYDASNFARRIVYTKGHIDDPLRDAEGFIIRNFGYCNFDRVISGGGGTYSITHPSGARADYVFTPMRHGRKNVEENCMDAGDTPSGANNFYPLHHDVLSLTSKTLSGAGIGSQVYQYRYTGLDSGYQVTGDPQRDQILRATPVPNYKTVTVVEPDGTEQVSVFGRDYNLNEGRLFRTETRKSGVEYRSTAYDYLSEDVVGAQEFPGVVGTSMTPNSNWLTASAIRPVIKTMTIQDGVAYVSQVSTCAGTTYCFDGFGRATTIVKWNNLGFGRTEVSEYHDDHALWVIGQPKRGYNIETGFVEYETSYNAQALPVWSKKYGKLQQTITYHGDGTVATVADGRNNVTTLSNWKRGIPQQIQFPVTPEAPTGAIQSAVIDDNGWITSTTDENSYATGYSYDSIGRLTGIAYPTEDTTIWSPKGFEFRPLISGDWLPSGISAGQWRHYEGQGNYAKFTYFDAMWRPVLVLEYDTSNVTPTVRYTRTAYDSNGRVSFQSYPVADPATTTTGIRTFYDALDRVTSVEQDSEHDVLTTKTEYLAGLQVRVTNPRDLPTTTGFMAWDQPGYDLPLWSSQPEGKVIEISRHPQFGWPLQLKQRSADNSLQASRQYVYDGNAQLCKTIEPETGASVMGYDASGNLAWQVSGLPASSFGTTNDCQHVAAAGTGLAVGRTYDNRNRLTHLTFPDGKGNQIWTYEKDNLPASVTAYNGTGNTHPVVTAYTYNKRRLLTGESLSQPSYTWGIGYEYDSIGNLRWQSYPTGLKLDFAPNALGQATQARNANQSSIYYASGAQYFPNGALKQFAYGNGIVHTMTQNARQLPARVTSSGNVLDFGYDYDKNGNPTTILDLVTGTPTAQHRWMTYDGLDRLITSASAMYGGSDHTHRFTYDALDNIESWKHAGVKDYADYVYDAQNRLTNIRNTAGASVVGIGYDAQGNLANKNGQAYDFDYGNRLRNVPGKEGYRYDGLGRRVQTTKSDDSQATLWQYGQTGQMLFSTAWEGSNYLNQKTHESVYLAGSLIATIDHDWPSNAVIATKYQHTDALGSPVAVTNEAGAVIERNNYEPYGAIIGNPTRGGIGYTGHVMDGATGLTYMQQRYYDQAIGRFLSVDPVTANANTGLMFNRYNYASNNPYKFVDPDGREIRVAPFAPADYARNVAAAIRHLNSVGEATAIGKLHMREEIYYIRPAIDRTNAGEDTYGAMSIIWADHGGVLVEGQEGMISPALALGHEAEHLLRKVEGKENFKPDDQYDTTEERAVIEGYEQRAARKLGEPVRTDHRGRRVRAPCVTGDCSKKPPKDKKNGSL